MAKRNDSVNFTPIGTVKSPYTEILDREWQDIVAEIHIVEPLAAGLHQIEENSHLNIIFYLHKSKFDPEVDLVRHPMDRTDLPKCGVFATRSNYRPNAIGLTMVELLKVSGSVLTVRGLDALDGTPVLDIKPYVPRMNAVEAEKVRTPEWGQKLREEKEEDS